MDAPLCECHGEPKRWAIDKRCREGGYWRCRVKEAAFNASAKGRARDRRYAAKRLVVHVADSFHSYRVDPAQKDALKAQLAAFKARQRDKEVPVGRLDETVPRA